jgi:hypothetical protein
MNTETAHRPWLRRWHVGRRHGGRVLAVIVAIAAAAVMSSVTVDLGPTLRAQAELGASAYLKRPMHIGRLSVRLLAGEFELGDVVIEGLKPADRPFLKAKRITVSLPWWTVLGGDLVIDSVHMTDWDMTIEIFRDGRHSLPRLAPERRPASPPRFTTTVREVRTERGQFTFEDHGTPWGVICRNLSVTVVRSRNEYRGRSSFTGGTVRIQDFVPMGASMETGFVIRGGKVHLDRIDLLTDGARSVVTGDVDFGRWPEQLYQVRSHVDFPRMREIFFANEKWRLTGEGDFDGTFHIFKGGRELTGRFRSAVAGVNEFRFPDLAGSLIWLPKRFEVFDASSGLFGGRTTFRYELAPIGTPGGTPATFDASYEDVDLAALTDFFGLEGGLRLAGRASGRNLLQWRLGHFAEHHGDGEIVAQPPPGVHVAERRLAPETVAAAEAREPEVGPFNPTLALGYLPIGGRMTYEYGPDTITLHPSVVATPATYVAFEGETAYGDQSRIPFHVTTSDWQESDRLLAALMTAFGASTSAVPVGGYGEFDGLLLKAFRAPRVEGSFTGRQLRAWDVRWGQATGRVVIENGYIDITGGLVADAGSSIAVDGRFALGYPRRDGGEELNATVRVERRPLVDFRHAFNLDDYDLEGVASGEFHLYGRYERPFGFGRMTIEDAVAYGERFERATGTLRFEGAGVRLDGIEMTKGSAAITGAAYIDWDGNYSFNSDGHRIPIEQVQALTFPRAPLSGVLEFTASGAGNFEAPRYEVRGRVADLFAGEEGIGQVTGRLSVRGELLTLEVEGASPRLTVSGSGRIALTPQADAELTFRFADTSLDPYVRFFEPRLSPFTTAVASGTLRVVGELFDVEHLRVDARVESVGLGLFDYGLRNDGPIDLALDQNVVRIGRMRLVGEGTALDLAGEVRLGDERIALRATGDANLGILQGFFRNLRSSGGARIVAEATGPLREPVFSGSAVVTDGRVRHFALPHGIEAINGRISFDAGGVRMDDVTARLGGGDVRFGGRIAMKGYVPSEFGLTATGERMRLRYPEGFRSEIDADLALRGPIAAPTLSGTVVVRDALFTRRFDWSPDLLSGLTGQAQDLAPAESSLPLRFDLRLSAPSTLRLENNTAQMVASADLTLSGTYDRPLLFGHAEIERGEFLAEGNRYRVTRGTIDFTNPTRIQPFFDFEAETRVRVPGQTYRVTLRATGTPDRMAAPEFSSDPPLPVVDIISLLLGEVYDPQDAEITALESRRRSEQALISGAARLLTSPISSGVNRVAEQTLGVDSVQIAPLAGNTTTQSLNPAARLTIGKRISSRAFLTYSRSLNAAYNEQIIFLEYDQSDRWSWVLSQNEDKTYALDFRVRHIF